MAAPAHQRPQLRALPGGATARPTDEQIVAALVAGDPRIAGELYDLVLPSVDRALYRVFGRREVDHEDLVQSTFEQILKTLTAGRYAGACSLKTWAGAIATHVGLNALRARRRQRKVFEQAAERHDASPDSSQGEPKLQARMAMERLRQELGAMRPDRAEAVFLHDVLGHELAEIAVITGVSVSAAQSRLVRGRKELMERLGAVESENEQ